MNWFKEVLDDLKYIHQKDTQDALGIAERQCEQLLQDLELRQWQPLGRSPLNVVFAGMGGSALAGLISGVWPGYGIPFELCRDYTVPRYLSDRTLFVAASYSGNTEETVAAVTEAAARGAMIMVIAGGGRLQEMAEQKNWPHLIIPKVQQPRFAVFYSLKALVKMLQAVSLIPPAVENELAGAATYLRDSVRSWTAVVPATKNPAKQLAQELMGKSIVVYSGPKLMSAAYKWKISFNENAKNVAWLGTLPEFNHNEFIGWSGLPAQKPYAIVDLRSNLEHPRVQKRFLVSETLLSGLRPTPQIVETQGDSLLGQILWTVTYGDFVSIYLALLNGVNPTPVDLVEKFKTALSS